MSDGFVIVKLEDSDLQVVSLLLNRCVEIAKIERTHISNGIILYPLFNSMEIFISPN